MPAAAILAVLGITSTDAAHLADRFFEQIDETALTRTAVAVRLRAAPGPVHLKAYRLAEGWRIALGPLSLTRWQRVSSRATERRFDVQLAHPAGTFR